MELGKQLNGVRRCPHCGVANPVLVQLWISEGLLPRNIPGHSSRWGVYYCTTCGDLVSAKGLLGIAHPNVPVIKIFPSPKTVDEDIPDVARNFLQQAYETLHAPDAAAMTAGSAVDAMLKEKGYSEGSLYDRIDKAVEGHVLTEAMGTWAHQVRLGSNRPRHADADKPHVTADEAKQSVEFAEALGTFLFVLTAKIERGIQSAKGEDEAS